MCDQSFAARQRRSDAPQRLRALARYRAPGARFDIVLTDVIMPGIGGAALVREIRAVSPAQKIAFLSGYTDDMMASQGVVSNTDVVLVKPVVDGDLVAEMRRLLGEPVPKEDLLAAARTIPDAGG